MFRLPKDTKITETILDDFLSKHQLEVNSRYSKLENAYLSQHDILNANKKEEWKPDNRIVVNFPKYIVDVTNGFFIGNPVKVTATDPAVTEYVNYLNKYNGQDDSNAEIAKICGIFGKGFVFNYANEYSELCTAYFTPKEAFIIYDDTIAKNKLFWVRVYEDNDKNKFGYICDKTSERNFSITGGVKWIDEWKTHGFAEVPAVEFVENEERQGVFEPVLTMVNAYNKAISEKANDNDAFSDAYMKIIGSKVDEDTAKFIRNNRIINIYNTDGDDSNIIVDFMAKPSNDAGQEHLLDRLERHIFQIGQSADVSDENFGTTSGIAMLYKMWATSNKGKTKERKFTSSLDQLYRILFSHPLSKVPADAWLQLEYKFTPNIPANLLEETQIATNLEGITSHKTQLKALSIVQNVEDELEAIEEENKPDESLTNKILGFGDNEESSAAEETQREKIKEGV